jgi:hypothetical protein
MVMRYLRVVLILMCGALLVNPPEGESCGPWIPVAQFGYVNNPGPEFMKGELGVLSPHYYRRNLVVAYRYLSGAPLRDVEIRALSPNASWSDPSPGFEAGVRGSVAEWLQARGAVAGAPEMKDIQADRNTMVEGKYTTYRNCLGDAFVAASQTVAARVKLWGAASPQTAEWLRGQDQVFANCVGDHYEFSPPPGREVKAEYHAPAPLPAGAGPLLAADRQYQTAAALFYAAKFKEAAEAFRAVEHNANSPWSEYGRYLTARALLRQGTVDGDKGALAEAEKTLTGIVSDPGQKRWRKSAQGLLEYVRGYLHPRERMVELETELAKPQSAAAFAKALTDYTMLWDQAHQTPVVGGELTGWISTFQEGGVARAIERWREGGNEEWLIAALAHVKPSDAATPELVEAARKVSATSPAYATAAFHGIRLLAARGGRDAAREWVEQALPAKLGVSAHNAFLAERMTLARDFTEFLRYSARRPVAATGSTADEDFDSQWRKVNDSPAFDEDAADAFNQRLPLRFWEEAAGSNELPPGLRGEIAQAAWVRAVLLERPEQARRFAAALAALRPELADRMRSYVAEKTPEAARFTAAHAMLRNPGLGAAVRSGFGRETNVGKLDALRDNWWSFPLGRRPAWEQAVSGSERQLVRSTPEFLSASQREEAANEAHALETAAPVAPNYLCGQTIAWALGHRDDPRIPEALHLCVQATRLAAPNPENSAWSKRAFQLLHARYPKSEWAAKTKYWY